LLEFPRRARSAPPPETRPLPAWRAELNEKIKAIRASRGGSVAVEAAVEEIVATAESESAMIVRRDEAPNGHGREMTGQNGGGRVESGLPTSTVTTAVRRPSNTIVEAALVRVKRATEAASRASLPKIEPARISVPIDREATARALEPANEIERRIEMTPAPVPEVIQPPIIKPSPVAPPAPRVASVQPTVVSAPVVAPAVPRTVAPAATNTIGPTITNTAASALPHTVAPAVPQSIAPAASPAITTVGTTPVAPALPHNVAPSVSPTIATVAPVVPRTVVPAVSHAVAPALNTGSLAATRLAAPAVAHSVSTITTAESVSPEFLDESSFPAIDDLEPLDYLEAEIRKVDKVLAAEFKRDESPSVITHAVIGIVDLIAIAVSCSPFLALVRIYEGSFSLNQTRIASGLIVGLIAFFYLAMTQCLCGKTFGMMLTNTRIVDATEYKTPSLAQSLVRTAGYYIAAVPALIGFLWAVINRKHRGWHDYVSGTVVVRDF